MPESLILHYAPDNASMIVRLVLEELGLPYETRLVDRASGAQGSAAYRALNPAGLIPALETPDGVMAETGAILLWLADRHRRMAPAVDSPERGAFLHRLFFLSNTLHPMLRMSFYPGKYVGRDAGARQALRDTLRGPGEAFMTLPRALAQLEGWLAPTGAVYFGGAAPSVIDAYAAAVLRWCGLYPEGQTGWFDLGAYAALRGMAAAFEARESAQAVARAEGLGPRPFTDPQTCQPPEGSAL
ncbi:glutathione S-transferase family protein [Tropicibacter sp. S64]|uniref:glutathione S-transferase family protein n=1 Tax=Tropicibacter sp. S64 TaxID=3415122 RepID=UPI003C7D2DB5